MQDLHVDGIHDRVLPQMDSGCDLLPRKTAPPRDSDADSDRMVDSGVEELSTPSSDDESASTKSLDAAQEESEVGSARCSPVLDCIPMAAVEARVAAGELLVIFRGSVLSLSRWARFHPGGERVLKHMAGTLDPRLDPYTRAVIDLSLFRERRHRRDCRLPPASRGRLARTEIPHWRAACRRRRRLNVCFSAVSGIQGLGSQARASGFLCNNPKVLRLGNRKVLVNLGNHCLPNPLRPSLACRICLCESPDWLFVAASRLCRPRRRP